MHSFWLAARSALIAILLATRLDAAPVTGDLKVYVLNFTKNLNEAAGFPDLGLRGADPLLLFSIVILTGLFSNRVFDWLKDVAQGVTTAKPGGAPTQRETAAAETVAAPES